MRLVKWCLGLFVGVIIIFGVQANSFAYHQGLVWSTYTFYWLSHENNHADPVYVVSNDCNFYNYELQALSNSEDQTRNKSELPDMPNGYNLYHTGYCDGAMSSWDDLLFQYEDLATWNSHGHSYVGGVTFHNPASSDWCQLWGASYPCGDHWVTIHMNKDKITKPGYPIVKTLMHEMGHATGLGHHCTGDSLMNDGSSGCNGGTFPGQWYSTDRTGLYNNYH